MHDKVVTWLRSVWIWELGAVLLALIGVFVRCLAWDWIFTDNGVILPGVDPYYHIRHAQLLVANLPSLVQVDPYLSFPQGAPISWPPLFDLLLALPTLLGFASQKIWAFGAFGVTLLGGLAVYLTYRFGSLVFGRSLGLLACGFVALMPGAINFASLGRIDHHAVVAVVELAMFLSFLAALRAQSEPQRWLFSVATGLWASVSVGSWVITPPYYFLPIPLTLIGLCLLGQHQRMRFYALVVMGSALLAVTVMVLWVADLKARFFALHQPSFFTILLFGLAFLGCVLAAYRPRWFWPVFAVGFFGLLVLVATRSSLLPEVVHQTLAMVSSENPYFRIVRESDPLFLHNGVLSLRRPVNLYSYLILLWPFLVGYLLWRFRGDLVKNPARLLFGLYALWSVVLLMLQERFGEYAAPSVAVVVAWMLQESFRAISQLWSTDIATWRRWILGGTYAVVLLLAVWPIKDGLGYLVSYDPVSYQRSLVAFSKRFGELTPKPEVASGRLRYGVLCGWMDGHPLLAIAARPVMVSAFTTPEGEAGTRQAFSILLDPDEQRAYRTMVENRLRYVLVSPIETQVAGMAKVIGSTQEYMRVSAGSSDQGSYQRFDPLPAFYEIFHSRLLMDDGQGMDHFRLLLESGEASRLGDRQFSTFKAFEAVAGARLHGQAQPGELVRLRVDVHTNLQRTFVYAKQVRADQQGRFELRMPYWTEGTTLACHTQGPVRIKVGQRVVHMSVSETAVRQGLKLPVPGS